MHRVPRVPWYPVASTNHNREKGNGMQRPRGTNKEKLHGTAGPGFSDGTSGGCKTQICIPRVTGVSTLNPGTRVRVPRFLPARVPVPDRPKHSTAPNTETLCGYSYSYYGTTASTG
eukprot:1604603-Rhodomonas_salina.1